MAREIRIYSEKEDRVKWLAKNKISSPNFTHPTIILITNPN